MTEEKVAVYTMLGTYRFIIVILLLSALLSLIGNWRLFQKAGKEGWYALIPIYSGFIKHKITFGESNKWYYFIGWVIGAYYLYTHFCYVRAFGVSKGLAVLGLFFPGITTLMLAFGSGFQKDKYHAVSHILG